MKPIFILLFFYVKFQGGNLLAQVPAPCPFPAYPAADWCPDACIDCNLNGYTGSTEGFTPQNPPNFCGSIENEQWIAFLAASTSVTITATPSNCTLGNGIQLSLYPSCNSAFIACNGGSQGGGETPVSITAALSPGEDYYLLIDGYGGDQCDFTLEASPQFAVMGCEAQAALCISPTVAPADLCADACAYCDLDGKTGSTAGYTGESVPGFCGIADNTEWLAFFATGNTVSITVTPSNCTQGDGLEVALLPECDQLPVVCNDGQCCGGTIPVTISANVVPGEDYYLLIDGDNGDVCDFTISVTPPGAVTTCPASNPVCVSNAEQAADECELTCIYCNLNGKISSNTGATGGSAAVGHFCGTVDNDVWFGFVANAASATISVSPQNCTGSNGLEMALYSECGYAPLACTPGSPGGGTVTRSVTATLAPGSNYYLMVDGYAGDVCDFSVSVTPASAVQNCGDPVAGMCTSTTEPGADDCTQACIHCALNGKLGNTAGYTASTAGVLCMPLENDQWYGFNAAVPSATFTITPSNCVQSQGVQVALVRECGFTPLVCNTGGAGGLQPRSVSYNAFQVGQPYYLMVDGYNGDECDFVITVNPPNAIQDCTTPPPGCLDGIAGMETCGEACTGCSLHLATGSTAGATLESVPGFCSEVENSQWFAFTAPSASTTLQILPSNCQHGDGLQAAIFPQCGFAPIICRPGYAGGGFAALNLNPVFVPGKTYWLMIDGYDGDECDFTIIQSPVPPAVSADECSAACTFCYLDGYSGSTNGFTPHSPANFCGSIENEQWLGFVAGTSQAIFTATPSNCTIGNGVQIAIYESCQTPFIDCNGGSQGGGETPVSIQPILTPGEQYYLMIDSYGGDQCDFTLTVDPPGGVNNCSPILPVELLAFQARCRKTEALVELSWNTASEQNLDYFLVERSVDAVQWIGLERLSGTGTGEYAVRDTAPMLGQAYYRIKMVDVDGTFAHSPIRSVDCGNGLVGLHVWTNPEADLGTFRIEAEAGQQFDVTLYDVLGRLLQTWADVSAGRYDFPMRGFAQGWYWVVVRGEDVQMAERLRWP